MGVSYLCMACLELGLCELLCRRAFILADVHTTRHGTPQFESLIVQKTQFFSFGIAGTLSSSSLFPEFAAVTVHA